MTSFLSEIRRRNVFKVTVAYLVVAWILIQIADVLAQQLSETPYKAVFDPAQPVTVHDTVLPALILALDERELAVKRFVLNAKNEPADVLGVIWDPQLDPIRCDASFQKTVTRLKIVDQRAARICQP